MNEKILPGIARLIAAENITRSQVQMQRIEDARPKPVAEIVIFEEPADIQRMHWTGEVSRRRRRFKADSF